jgi:hypothetical protein
MKSESLSRAMRSTAVGASWSLEMRSRLLAEPEPGLDGGAGWVGAPVAETAQRMATAAVVKWNIVVVFVLMDSTLERSKIKEVGMRCCWGVVGWRCWSKLLDRKTLVSYTISQVPWNACCLRVKPQPKPTLQSCQNSTVWICVLRDEG